ncbi:MAG: class I SAM-dependent methyltransferase [Patescibacteria group bacterium]|nr:class I SAM-dependent methyltransferase [Patescibacteria group bacterium]
MRSSKVTSRFFMKQVYKEVKSWYNNNLDSYLKSGDVLMQDKLDKFLECVSKKGKILDMGSGTGRDVKYFIEKGYDGFGIDISEKMIAYANKNNKGKFYLMNMVQLIFEGNYFDGIWASSSLFTHLTFNDIESSLKEVRRTLKKNGVFGVIAMKKEKGDIEPDDFVFNKFTKKEILVYLTKCGFKSFYIKKFSAHKRDWFYIISKKI